MTPASGAGLFAVAVAGGIINSISGGGTFVVFPSLLLAGIPAVNANATNTVALWPGVISSAVAMRGELRLRTYLFPMAVISVIGGAAGATLVLALPAASFERAVPFLLLGATLLFATNPLLARSLRLPRPDEQPGNGRFAVTLLAQLGIAIYGGYFGGGIGILMLAALGLLGFTDFRTITAYRLCLSCCINAAAVVAFI
ncbi:MAG: TSUP family transporter, partial [Chloroflexi bacterium]|nr:TSUP family transporter [Chloroflexota bacterium]